MKLQAHIDFHWNGKVRANKRIMNWPINRMRNLLLLFSSMVVVVVVVAGMSQIRILLINGWQVLWPSIIGSTSALRKFLPHNQIVFSWKYYWTEWIGTISHFNYKPLISFSWHLTEIFVTNVWLVFDTHEWNGKNSNNESDSNWIKNWTLMNWNWLITSAHNSLHFWQQSLIILINEWAVLWSPVNHPSIPVFILFVLSFTKTMTIIFMIQFSPFFLFFLFVFLFFFVLPFAQH